MSTVQDFEEIAGDLLELPGIHSIRWQNREAAHIVTIDAGGANREQRAAIKARADRIVRDWPNRVFVFRIREHA